MHRSDKDNDSPRAVVLQTVTNSNFDELITSMIFCVTMVIYHIGTETINIIDGLIDGFTRPVKREKIDWYYLFLEVTLSICECFHEAWYYERDDNDLYCQTWGRE